MKQIIPGLWDINEVGSFAHCYLWEWEGGLTLIDTGFTSSAPKILKALVDHGHPLHRLKRIILTHVDLDHSGGAFQIRKATGALVTCHAAEREFLQRPTLRHRGFWLPIRPIVGLLALLPAYRPRGFVADELLVEGQTLPEGFIVIHTPGHTPGHISLLHREKRLLITGDVLSHRVGRLRGPQPVFTPELVTGRRSVWKLAKQYGHMFDVIAFGHGPPILQNGGKRVQGLASRFFSDVM